MGPDKSSQFTWKNPRNLLIAGAVLLVAGSAAVAAMAVGSKTGQLAVADDSATPGFGGSDAKSSGSAPNVKSDYRPSGNSGSTGLSPKTTETKNSGAADNQIASIKQPGTSVATHDTNPLNVITFGSDSAPLTIVEYGSFTCSHCGEFAHNEFTQIKATYIDKGLVRLVFRPLSRNAMDVYAGLLVTCLQPQRRAPMVELLYRQQASWIPFNAPDDATAKTQLVANLKGFGRNAGLSDQSVDQCLTNQTNQKWLQAILQASTDDGVEGTPSFMINGKKYSNMTFADWQKTINPLLPKTN
jgi:protein-disulfide isomerase